MIVKYEFMIKICIKVLLFIFMLLHMYSLSFVVDIYSEQNPLSVANILNIIDEKKII